MERVISDKIKFVYNNTSSNEINEVILYFQDNYEYVMHFFDKSSLNKPLVITIWDDKDEFKKEMSKLSGIEEIPDWAIGMADSKKDNKINRIDCLSLKKIREIPYHSGKFIDDMGKLVIHEFVHICHDEFSNYNETIPTWVQEGVAVYLSRQHENSELTVSLEEIKNDDMVPYDNYRYVFDKVVSNCSKEEIFSLLNGQNTYTILDNVFLRAKK